MPSYPGQWQQKRQKRADGRTVGLMNAVAHGQRQQIGAALGKGAAQQGHGLDVGYGVGEGVALQAARRGPWLVASGSAGRTTMARHWGGGTMRHDSHRSAPSQRQRQSRPASRQRHCPDGLQGRKPLRECVRSPSQAGRSGPPERWQQAGRRPTSRNPCPAECRWPCGSPEGRWDASRCSRSL